MHSKSISGLNMYVNASLNYKYSNLHIPRIYLNPLRWQKKKIILILMNWSLDFEGVII